MIHFFTSSGQSIGAWTARKSNQSVLKEINPEYFFEGLMLKLKLQYFGLVQLLLNDYLIISDGSENVTASYLFRNE